MVFSFLDKKNLSTRYTAAKRYTDELTTPFQEYERLANNRPSAGIDPNYPKTTDGTTASIIRKTPRRVIQQLPTGQVENDSEDWLSVVADFILTNKLLPFANEEYDLLQKCWTSLERGLTFGVCATYTPFLNHNGYFCPDVSPVYWGDIMLQPGKKSGYACSYVFMRSWWQPEDIDALINRERKLASKVKGRGETYESTWDINGLKKVKDSIKKKDQQATTPAERERKVSNEAVELVTGFQMGVGSKFYTFEPNENIVVRTETNKDPRGKIPIDWLYGDVDGTNPLGRGIVELIGGLQNLIDSDMQMYQYNRALMLAPPMLKRGNWNKNKARMAVNALIDLGSDPNADLIPLKVDTSAVINYPSLYGLQKSQLLNLVSSPDTSISGEIGNPGFGKTPTAINQQKANISVDDNYVRKMFEAWFENWAETAINLYFAKRAGKEELQLDEDTANRLIKLADQEKFDLSNLKDNKITIDYDTATPALKFRVNASTSKMNDDMQQLQALSGLKDSLESSQVLAGLIVQKYPEKVLALWNSLVSASAVEDPEELTIDIKAFKEEQEQALEMQQQQQAIQAEQPPMQLEQPQIPEGEVVEPPMSEADPDDEAIAQMLSGMGFNEEQIAQAIEMLNAGAPQEAVMEMLAGSMNG